MERAQAPELALAPEQEQVPERAQAPVWVQALEQAPVPERVQVPEQVLPATLPSP